MEVIRVSIWHFYRSFNVGLCGTLSPSTSPTSNPTLSPTISPPPTHSPLRNPTGSPTIVPCGDGECKASDNETADTCSADCVSAVLPLSTNSNSFAKAVVFTVQSKNDSVGLTGFEIVGKDTDSSNVRVYMRDGDYNSFSDFEDEDTWIKLYDGTLGLVKEVPTNITNFNRIVSLPLNSVTSFQIYVKDGLSFEKSSTVGSIDDDLIEVRQGNKLNDKFKRIKDDGLPTGSIK